jgi:hypothetical protein
MKQYILTLIFLTLGLMLIAQEQTIKDYFFDGLSINLIIAMSLWAYIGMVINMVSDVLRRKPDSVSSPRYISVSYWWKDNYKRLILSIILVPVIVIVYSEAFTTEITILGAIGLGFASDHLLEIVKRKIPQLGTKDDE